MDCKVGDTVHARGTVEELCGRDGIVAQIRFRRTSSGAVPVAHIDFEDIVHVEPRPITVGDTVRHTGASEPHLARMYVNAIVDGRAWCRSSGYDYILEVEKLERVEKVER